jgi:pimeloyl-ACP methyl ester carboxylesterase
MSMERGPCRSSRRGQATPFNQETAMNLPAMLRAPGQGITIRMAHWPGPGPNVLAVHGLTANCRSFDTIAQETAPPLNLYAVDLRGRGLSDHPETGYSLEHHSDDLAQVIAYLGLERMVVMGHSLGAFRKSGPSPHPWSIALLASSTP